MSRIKNRFWETKSLENMTRDEWESLCDGCGRCCLFKVEEEDTGRVSYTCVACRHLDLETCRCMGYKERHQKLPQCIVLTPESVMDNDWLPSTCAYRRIREGKGLDWWHPLVSGSRETVHQSHISIRDKAISETYADLEHLEAYTLDSDL